MFIISLRRVSRLRFSVYGIMEEFFSIGSFKISSYCAFAIEAHGSVDRPSAVCQEDFQLKSIFFYILMDW